MVIDVCLCAVFFRRVIHVSDKLFVFQISYSCFRRVFRVSDRCMLKDQDASERLKEQLVTYLLYIVRRDHPQPLQRFSQLIDILINLRDLTDIHMNGIKNIFMQFPEFSSYDLVQEFL